MIVAMCLVGSATPKHSTDMESTLRSIPRATIHGDTIAAGNPGTPIASQHAWPPSPTSIEHFSFCCSQSALARDSCERFGNWSRSANAGDNEAVIARSDDARHMALHDSGGPLVRV